MVIKPLRKQFTKPLDNSTDRNKSFNDCLRDNYRIAVRRIDKHPTQLVMQEALRQCKNILILLRIDMLNNWSLDLQNVGRMITLVDAENQFKARFADNKVMFNAVPKSYPDKNFFGFEMKYYKKQLNRLESYTKQAHTYDLVLSFQSTKFNLKPQQVKEFLAYELIYDA